jgi:hypothetical protein
MVFSDEDHETIKYTDKEFREMMAKEALEQSGKADSYLNDRLHKIELMLKDIGGKYSLCDPSVNSQVKPLEPGEEGDVDFAQTSGAKKPSEPYSQFNFAYPKSNPLMPHINYLEPALHYDGTHFSFWKTSMESHLRSYSEELWDVWWYVDSSLMIQTT